MTGETLLDALVGEWNGTYKLWLEPGVLRSESTTRASICPVLEGRYVVHDYRWSDQDAPQRGTMLLGRDRDDLWHMAWADTWHTGLSIMSCVHTSGADATVLGSYEAGDQQWGWRTSWKMSDADHLIITAWNISPNGDAAKATETSYDRRSS